MPFETTETFAPPLPRFVRYRDLHAAGIVTNWQQLNNLIDEYGFPPGQLLSPNTRVWAVHDVEAWLASRPTERKIVAPRRHQQEGHHEHS